MIIIRILLIIVRSRRRRRRSRPRAIPLAKITMRKAVGGFLWVLAGFYRYGAPLCGPSGRWSSAIISRPK